MKFDLMNLRSRRFKNLIAYAMRKIEQALVRSSRFVSVATESYRDRHGLGPEVRKVVSNGCTFLQWHKDGVFYTKIDISESKPEITWSRTADQLRKCHPDIYVGAQQMLKNGLGYRKIMHALNISYSVLRIIEWAEKPSISSQRSQLTEKFAAAAGMIEHYLSSQPSTLNQQPPRI